MQLGYPCQLVSQGKAFQVHFSYNASEESSFGERIEFVHKIMHRATAATSKGDNVEMSNSFNAKEDQNCLNLNDHSSWTTILGRQRNEAFDKQLKRVLCLNPLIKLLRCYFLRLPLISFTHSLHIFSHTFSNLVIKKKFHCDALNTM